MPGCGCGGGNTVPGHPAPAVSRVVATLKVGAASVQAVQSESVMDYWVGDQRVKGDVYLMGRVGARLRLNALLSPAAPSPSNLLTSSETLQLQLFDYNNNCQAPPVRRRGPRLFAAGAARTRDFYLLSFGAVKPPPGSPGPSPGIPTRRDRERVELHRPRQPPGDPNPQQP